MPRKKEMPKIHSASVNYNGNANKFDAFLAMMINDCLNSDWKPFSVKYDKAIPVSELTADEIASIIRDHQNSNKNSVA